MRFKIGQKVVCVIAKCSNPYVNAPRFNEVVTVHAPGYHRKETRPIIRIKEYLKSKRGRYQSFYEEQFEPLIDDKVLEEELLMIGQLANAN